MPIVTGPYQSTDQKMDYSPAGLSIFNCGPIYLQYGAATNYTNSVAETSLFTGITLGGRSTTTGNFGPDYPNDCSTLTIPANTVTPGTVFHMYLWGTIATTGTPTLRLRPGFVNTAATFTALSDTGTPTLGAVTGTTAFLAEYNIVCTAIGASGAFGTMGTVTYGTNSTTLVNTSLAIPFASVTIDTTQAQTFDLRATWGSASASNIISMKAGYIRIIG